MRSKTVFILLIMFSVVAVAAVIVRGNMKSGQGTAVAQTQAPMIMVAAKSLSVGTLLRPEDVRWHAWPTDMILPAHIARPAGVAENDTTSSDVIGAVLRRPMVEGEPVLAESLVKPGERGFLAAVLNPGMRAIAVAVNAVSGTAGLIFPGDHVDLILSQSFDRDDFPLSQRSVSETIVQNLRVLATDQKLQQSKPEQTGPDGRIARTVTLEVTREQAEKITVATELGRLSLTLRSLNAGDEVASADDVKRPAVATTWAADVSPALKLRSTTAAPKPARAPEVRTSVQVMRGSKSEQVESN